MICQACGWICRPDRPCANCGVANAEPATENETVEAPPIADEELKPTALDYVLDETIGEDEPDDAD